MNEPTMTIRASSFPALFSCAHRWEAIHILKMKSTVGLRAILGTAVHHGTATFDQSRIDDSGITISDATDAFIDKLRKPESDFDPAKDDLKPKEAEFIGISLLTDYCKNWSPKFNFSAVEMTVAPLDIDCGDGITIRLTGTLDRSRIAKFSGGEGICDIKTSGAAVSNKAASTKGHVGQIGTYELLFEHTTGRTINGDAEIIGMKTKGKPEIATGKIFGAKRILVGDSETPGLLDFAKMYLKEGKFPPDTNSILCNEKYCPRWKTCKFKGD